MTGGPYRKSKLRYTLDEWIGWVRSLIRNNPKEYESLKQTNNLPGISELPNDKLLEEAIGEIESMIEIENNKYYQLAQNNPETLDNYIVMPGPGISKLLVGKERVHYGCRWEEAHLKLQKKKFYMPTLKQFVDFVNLLESGEARDGTGAEVSDLEAGRILEDILGNYGCGEWLDSKFIRKHQWIYLNQNYRYEGYCVTTWKSELLKQNCLLYESLLYDTLVHTFCYADVFGSANRQGMPTKYGDIGFYGPSEADPTVTIFGNWGEPVLICTADPEIKSPPNVKLPVGLKLPAIGVRPVRLKLDL